MYCTIISGALRGLESYIARVEVDVSRGLPVMEMVGLLGSEVKEARERIRVALKNSGMELKPAHITVNISPADVHKEGTAFDLPVAVGLLAAQEMIPAKIAQEILFWGELGLSGEVKAVKGVLPIVLEAKKAGIKQCVLPYDCIREAILADALPVMGVKSLAEAIEYLKCNLTKQKELREKVKKELSEEQNPEKGIEDKSDFADIYGQEAAKRCALTAAAGFHNLLLMGAPGTGKTMIARCLPGILPPLTKKEQTEVSAIYSVAGLLKEKGLVQVRPFVSPHHTVSPFALSGGGSIPKPGLVSLAHRGVLFLDEMAEFKRSTLDVLRQPMEEKRICISRNSGTYVYPADFMLVAASNPCPCGYYPDKNRCRCREYEIRRYLGRISGPILDRIDICAQMQPMDTASLLQPELSTGMSSKQMLSKVLEARERQTFRYRDTGLQNNGDLSSGELSVYCPLGSRERKYLEQIVNTFSLSARACHRIIRVARTLADLEGKEKIECRHLGEAACYKVSDTSYFGGRAEECS